MEDFRGIFRRLYSFIWDAPSESQDDEKIPEVQTQLLEAVENTKLNLKAFLEATKNHVPNNADYNQLCAYFASQSLNPKATCDVCNKAWGYSDRETETLIQKAVDANDFQVTKGSMIKFLQDNATQAWDEREIFGDVELEALCRFFLGDVRPKNKRSA